MSIFREQVVIALERGPLTCREVSRECALDVYLARQILTELLRNQTVEARYIGSGGTRSGTVLYQLTERD